MRRISGGRLCAEMPLEIGESRRRQTGECGDAVCGEKMPVPRLPRSAQSLIRALLDRDPQARPTAADVLAHPWVVRLAGATPRAEWALEA